MLLKNLSYINHRLIPDYWMRSAECGLPERKKELINEKVEHIIKYVEKYKLIDKLNDNEIRLICVGNRIDLVSKNIKEKFFKNWVEEKSNELGKEKALNEYKRMAGIKQLSDFPELFKIQD
jgi:hypothetical protein